MKYWSIVRPLYCRKVESVKRLVSLILLKQRILTMLMCCNASGALCPSTTETLTAIATGLFSVVVAISNVSTLCGQVVMYK